MMVDATASILSMKKREGFQLLWVAIGEFTTKNKGVFFALDHWFLFDELKRNSQFEWIFHSDVRHHQNATWFEFFGICVRREWPYESGIHNVKIALHASRGSSVGRSHQKICIAYQAIRRELIILETNGRFIACSQGSSWMKASKSWRTVPPSWTSWSKVVWSPGTRHPQPPKLEKYRWGLSCPLTIYATLEGSG